MLRTLVIACALLAGAVGAHAVPGYGFAGWCYSSKLLAAEALCRDGYPSLSHGPTLTSGTTNTGTTWQFIQTCSGVYGSGTPYLILKRSGTTTATPPVASQVSYHLRADDWPTCETDDLFSMDDALLLGWGIAGAWILAAALMHMRRGL